MGAQERSARIAVAAIALVTLSSLVALRAASAPAWPDDWDGIGFVLSIARFDMDRFAPHPPGYPVYVALLKIAAHVVADPIRAANAVAIASGVGATVLSWAAARRAIDPSRAWWVAIAMAVTPLVWRASSAIGSEAPALMLLALVAFGLASDGWTAVIAVGLGVGLALGVRLSWAPICVAALALIRPNLRLRAACVAIVATAAWAVPFVAIVGAAHARALLFAHVEGHWTRWGGTTISDPGASRALYLARDLFVDGLGAGSDGLGIAIALTSAALAKVGIDAWRESGWRHARAIAVAVVPYLVWIAVGQNLRQQPRHALPLVAMIAVAFALAATSATRNRTLGILFIVLAALRTFGDARDRLENPPAGVELAMRVRALPDASRVAVFGGPSARFFELYPGAAHAETASSLGDVSLAVGRMQALPSRVLVTSELDGIATSAYPLAPFARLCRPPRIDRRAPCLDVFEWRAPFLSR